MPDRPRDHTGSPATVDAHGRVVGAVNDRAPHNWGRWGTLDLDGTRNLVTDKTRLQAAELVLTGDVVSCGLPPQVRAPAPATESPVPAAADTDWLGLAHDFGHATMYNGFAVAHAPRPARTEPLLGRGVLLDLPLARGLDRLAGGHAVTARDLDACARAQDVELRDGDLLLLRTGALAHPEPDAAEHPGLSITTVDWIHRTGPAAIAVDGPTVEVLPFEPGHTTRYPLHARLIRDLGLSVGRLWWLEELAELCRREQRWEFLLSVPELEGEPLNPLAFF